MKQIYSILAAALVLTSCGPGPVIARTAGKALAAVAVEVAGSAGAELIADSLDDDELGAEPADDLGADVAHDHADDQVRSLPQADQLAEPKAQDDSKRRYRSGMTSIYGERDHRR